MLPATVLLIIDSVPLSTSMAAPLGAEFASKVLATMSTVVESMFRAPPMHPVSWVKTLATIWAETPPRPNPEASIPPP